jgi:hypothetical protein
VGRGHSGEAEWGKGGHKPGLNHGLLLIFCLCGYNVLLTMISFSFEYFQLH